MVRNTSFSVFAGQITGIFGLIGSGRTETAKVVAGVLKRDLFHGGEVRSTASRCAIACRGRRSGTASSMSPKIASSRASSRPCRLPRISQIGADRRRRQSRSIVCMSEMRGARQGTGSTPLTSRAIDGNARVIELSGGNQQKVVIAKSLVQKPKLIIFDEPTRGVDVGAIAEIHQLINRLADEGFAVAVISSYLPEIMALSDRILVARQGKIIEEMSHRRSDRTKDHVRRRPLGHRRPHRLVDAFEVFGPEVVR